MTPGLGVILLLAGGLGFDEAPRFEPLLPDQMPVFSRFGIYDEDTLRERLDRTSHTQGQAWVLSWVGDSPREIAVYRALLAAHPENTQYRSALIDALSHTAAWEQAIEVIEAGRGRAIVNPEARAPQVGEGYLDRELCYVLWSQGRLEEAKAPCRAGTALGKSAFAWRTRAWVLLGLGDDSEALTAAETAVELAPDASYGQHVLGVARFAVGDLEGARAAWTEALRLWSSYNEPWWALHMENPTVERLVTGQRQHLFQERAKDLAECGHYYLEMELPEYAKGCLAAADHQWPGISDAVRVHHLGISDPKAALELAMASLEDDRHPFVLANGGWAAYLSDAVPLARTLLEESLESDPEGDVTNMRLATVCEALGDTACVEQAEARGPVVTDEMVTNAVTRFGLMILPLLVAYLVLRPRVLRWLERRAAAKGDTVSPPTEH